MAQPECQLCRFLSNSLLFFYFLIHAFMLTDHTRDLGYLLHILSWIMFSAGKRQHPRLRNLRRILKRDNLQSTALGANSSSNLLPVLGPKSEWDPKRSHNNMAGKELVKKSKYPDSTLSLPSCLLLVFPISWAQWEQDDQGAHWGN